MATSTGATATANLSSASDIQAEALSSYFQGGIWTVEAPSLGSADDPAGTTVVDLKLQEFAFVYDKDEVASMAISPSQRECRRAGARSLLLKLADDVTMPELTELLASEDESGPPPFEDFGFLADLPPGEHDHSSAGAPAGRRTVRSRLLLARR